MRANVISVIALGLLTAACGSNGSQRAATGGLTGVGVGALVGGPIGAVVGGVVGAAGGAAMPEGADTLTANALNIEHQKTAAALNDAGLGSGSSQPPGTAQSSNLIRDAQAELQRDGLYKGRVDGIDGPATQQAVRQFQQREGLQQTAVLDQPTLDRLHLAGAASQTAQVNGRTAGERSGTSAPPAALSADDIRARLDQAGYTHVRDLQREANIYTARAEQGGTTYRLRVDARSGQVLSQHRLAAQHTGTARSGASGAPSTAQSPSATPVGGDEANPSAPAPPSAPGAVGSDDATNSAPSTNGTEATETGSGSSVPPSAGTSPSSGTSDGAAGSGTSSHGSAVTPPTPDQQSGGGAGATSGTTPTR